MIPATKITLRYATGLVSNLQIKELTREQFPNLWQEAENVLTRWSRLVAGQVDEVDFVIEYEDGQKYNGNIEIYDPLKQRRERLADHIRKHCEVYGGRKQLSGLSEQGYQDFLEMFAKNQLFCQKMLDEYEIGA